MSVLFVVIVVIVMLPAVAIAGLVLLFLLIPIAVVVLTLVEKMRGTYGQSYPRHPNTAWHTKDGDTLPYEDYRELKSLYGRKKWMEHVHPSS